MTANAVAIAAERIHFRLTQGRALLLRSLVKSKNLLILGFILLAAVFSDPASAHWKIPAGVKEWRYLNTPHFRIHYPAGYEVMASHAAVYAEEASARLENVLHHRLRFVIPVFLYASHQDFSATNIIPYDIDEGTGGFTDFYRRRVVVPFDGSYASLRHVLTHEIVHAYQFDILTGDEAGFPLWLVEGMAEFLSLGWDESAETHVRDAVLHDRMPSLAMLHAGYVSSGYMFYKGGQAVMLFIAVRWGEERIGFLLKELKSTRTLLDAIPSVFGMRAEEFDIEFGKFIRARYAPAFKEAVKGTDPRLRKVTWRYKPNQAGFNMHPALSPDGKTMAHMSIDGIYPAIVLRKIPGPGVKPDDADETKILLKALRSGAYEEFQPLTTRLSFSPDGSLLLIAGRQFGKQSLLVVDVKGAQVSAGYDLPFDAMHYPSFTPDGKGVVFTGVVRGRSDLFLYTFATKALRRLTDDWCYESHPRFSPDGKFLYYSSNRDPDDANRIDRPGRRLFRTDLKTGVSEPLTDLPGSSDEPVPARNGTLIFRSNFTGVPNLYRMDQADTRRTPAGLRDVTAVTQSLSGLYQPSLSISATGREMLAFTEIEEGAYEIKVLPAGIGRDGKPLSEADAVGPVDTLDENLRTFAPGSFQYPSFGYPLRSPLSIEKFGTPYEPSLRMEGSPFFLITGGGDAEGRATLAGVAFARMADDTGDHRLLSVIQYAERPVTWNVDVQYAYTKYRMDFFGGFYHHAGTAVIFNFLDFSLNNVLYNPYFRVLDQTSTGFFAGAEYPIHRYGSVSLAYDQGRDERIFEQAKPEERQQKDIFKNRSAVNVAYTFDNAAYTLYGPLDGHAVSLAYSYPLRPSGTERDMYAATGEFRLYHLFSSNFSTFAMRAFAGVVSGKDAADYPFQIGGYYTLRGYRFLEFQGTKAALFNLEYRFNFIEYLQFGIPSSWSFGLVRGVAFIDAGAAFDNPREFQAYDGRVGVTRDLHVSFGLGLHWDNFLRRILISGAVMKIDWATPYDGKRSLPLSKWKGEFSLGFNF